jgi:hypothetical protein
MLFLVLIALALCLLVLVVMTMGTVLLACFLIGGASGSRRIAAAVIGAPLLLLLPFFALGQAGTGASTGTEMVAAFVFMMGVCCAIAWPVAYFATRRLDRLTQFDPSVFE